MPDPSALKVVKSMILPVIDYGDTLYSVTNKTLMDQLQAAFDRALKTAYFMDEDKRDVDKLRGKAKVNLLIDRREMHLNSAAFTLSLCNDNIDDRDIRTRAHDGRMLKIIWPRDPLYRRSLEFRLPDTWNNLDIETRNITTVSEFQAWNKKLFLDKCT